MCGFFYCDQKQAVGCGFGKAWCGDTLRQANLLPFEVDSLALVCRHTTPSQNRSQLLAFDRSKKSRTSMRSFAITMAKLKARLGDASIFKLSYRDAVMPENSNEKIPLHETSQQQLPDVHQKALRPTWLLPSPMIIE